PPYDLRLGRPPLPPSQRPTAAALRRVKVLTRYCTTMNFFFEDKLFFTIKTKRLKANITVTILTTTTRLAYKLAFSLNALSNGFTVSHLRLTNIRINREFTF